MSLVSRCLVEPDLVIGGCRVQRGTFPLSVGEHTEVTIILPSAGSWQALLLCHSAADRGVELELEILELHIISNL